MKQNIGNYDRILRIVVGLIIGILGIVYNSWWGLIGLVPILTAFIRWCPLYLLLDLSTLRKKL